MPSNGKKFLLELHAGNLYNNIEICVQKDILSSYKRFKEELLSNFPLYLKKKAIKKSIFELIVSLNTIQEEGSDTTSFPVFVRRSPCVGVIGVFRNIDIIQKPLEWFIENKLNSMVKE